MKRLKHQVTGKTLPVSRWDKREIDYFGLIPVEIVINHIFSRLSGKSMGKCRCVSKLWSSILRRPNYKQLFHNDSPAPPRFLFSFVGGGKLVYFSSPQLHENPNEDLSLVATRHHTFPDKDFSSVIRPVHGFVCRQQTGNSYVECVVSNPITGECITTPKLPTNNCFNGKSYLGYDPVNKQFKVLCMTCVPYRAYGATFQHHVLTLETGNLLWRKNISYVVSFHFLDDDDDGICINGLLYYKKPSASEGIIVCFDVRSERVDFILGKPSSSTLVNYKGKLGAIDNDNYRDFVMWVLEDTKKHEWSKHVYEKPFQWWNAKSLSVCPVKVTSRGEIMFCQNYVQEDHFFIFYYDFDTKAVTRVKVQVPAFEGIRYRCTKVHTFPDYLEYIKLM